MGRRGDSSDRCDGFYETRRDDRDENTRRTAKAGSVEGVTVGLSAVDGDQPAFGPPTEDGGDPVWTLEVGLVVERRQDLPCRQRLVGCSKHTP